MTGTRQQWRHEPDLNAAQSRRRADRGTSWSSAHRGTEYRLIMASIVGLCAVGAAGSVVPGLDTAIGAVLVAAVLGALAVVAVRRQLRIRRRIADIDGTRPAVRPAAGATEPRVGPGVVTPVSPASITRAAHQLHPGTGPRAPRAARGGPRSPVHTARRCRMTTPQDPQHNTASTTQEIAALTARLRELSAQGRGADPAERAAFIADKDALIARITDPAANGAEGREGARATGTAREVPEQVVRARAVEPGYVLVGPSTRTWLRDPATGRPTAVVSEAEHRAVRELVDRQVLDTTDAHWFTDQDGHTDIHTPVVAPAHRDEGTDSVLADVAGDSGELAERVSAPRGRVANLEQDPEVRQEQLRHWQRDDVELADQPADAMSDGSGWVGDDGPGLP
ncbi:MAG: hypothetical protein J0I49_14965 [Pseudonocardia sp.]|jgi:hypothetical protein|uniref:hypothetical protein n=1 Tax=Pseudonocardia sp. TaxID=60912 RepID=UPI001AC0F027|nr:hypothetical protein [Pseudonocardia sp.]MBN9099395.1 hypothetical protein [Pseudonocardia sp.]